tara:strand:- start:835 stop:1914 length:1080 start_codon:yes stop_codon:yes gene_type:complete
MGTESHGLLDTDGQEKVVPIEIEDEVPPVKAPSTARWVALLSVPMLWGSYSPSMKLLLSFKHAPPAIVTNLASHLVGSVLLCCIWFVQRPPPHCFGTGDARKRAMRASLELGVYLFFGQLTQLLGLEGTSATVNAILVQASVVIVPLFDTADAPSRKASKLAITLARLLPSLLALAGVIVLTSAPSADEASSSSSRDDGEWRGVAFSLASAVFYALHTIRLSEYADVDATTQAAGQVVVNTALDVLALPVVFAFTGGAGWLAKASYVARQRLALAAAWNGLFVVGATTWAMSFAQQAFPASTAALAYAMEPLFAALFAAGLLHESIHPLQLLGGGLVVLANIVVASGSVHVLRCLGRCV